MKKSSPPDNTHNPAPHAPSDKPIPLYNEEILQYGITHGKGERLAACDISASDIGALCGSRIIMDVIWQTEPSPPSRPSRPSHLDAPRRIGKIGYHVDACALGTAAAAICAAAAIGAEACELQEIRTQTKKMLKGEDFSFKNNPRWEKLSLLRAARAYPSRHAAILLPLNALLKTFGNANHE